MPFAVLFVFALTLVLLPEYFPDHGVLYRAILEGDQERVVLMLERGADPNLRRATLSELCWFLLRPRNSAAGLPELGEQPPLVSIAIYKNQPAIARKLIEAGADPNARDERGYTPLSHAALSDDPALVRFLLDHGADAKLEMPDGSTALREGPEFRYGIRPAHPQIIQMLRAAME